METQLIFPRQVKYARFHNEMIRKVSEKPTVNRKELQGDLRTAGTSVTLNVSAEKDAEMHI